MWGFVNRQIAKPYIEVDTEVYKYEIHCFYSLCMHTHRKCIKMRLMMAADNRIFWTIQLAVLEFVNPVRNHKLTSFPNGIAISQRILNI